MRPSAHPRSLDPVHNACLIAFGWVYDPAGVYVMYWAFYDASGSQTAQEGSIVVLSLVATVDKWFKFDDRWDEVLETFDAPYFHMKEFAVGVGPFESWKDDKGRRAEFCRALIAVIKLNSNKVFLRAMHLGDFHRANAQYQLAEAFNVEGRKDAGAYTMAAIMCHDAVDSWVRDKKGGHVLHAFEDGDAGRKAAQVFIGKGALWMPKKHEETGRRVRQFEAADFVAWEFRRVIKQYLHRGDGLRASFLSMRKNLQCDAGLINGEQLVMKCRENPDFTPPRRDR